MQTSKQGTFGEDVMTYAKTPENVISAWSRISVHPHRLGGREFLFGSAEVGHVHSNRIVDIPFTRPVHGLLLAAGLAVQHQWVPNSGCITFHIRSERDIAHALWLMRLSYLRYALKEARDPRRLFENERAELHLTPRCRSLLEPFIPRRRESSSPEPVLA